MAGKRKTLPREIRELLKGGDIGELKRQFSRCEPNAVHINRFGSNIFSLSPLPREFALWAREQGADVNFKDHYGRFPIFMQASALDGDVQLLIDLGADVHVRDSYGTTPLHLAAVYGRTHAVRALLDAGAEVDAKTKELDRTLTPLEMTLSQDRLPYDRLLEICTLLLGRGAAVTEQARRFLSMSAERFQRTRRGISDADFLRRQTDALDHLYSLFDVAPAGEIPFHDGVSPIVIPETASPFPALWDYLVPPSGRAQTAQGEAIRIAGRIDDELQRNGGANWDRDYRSMLRTFPAYLRLGNPLPEPERQEAERIVRLLRDGRDDGELSEALCAYAAAWVLQNPEVLPPLPADYQR